MAQTPSLPSAPTYAVPGPMVVIRGDGSWLGVYPGGASGRLVSTSGVARFTLGVEDLDSSVVLSVGDYAEVYQVLSLDDIDTVIFNTVGVVNDARTWDAKILIDDVELASVTLPANSTTEADEAVAPVRRYAGLHAVAFRLEAN